MCRREAKHPTKHRLSRYPPLEIEMGRQEKRRRQRKNDLMSQAWNWPSSASSASSKRKARGGNRSPPSPTPSCAGPSRKAGRGGNKKKASDTRPPNMRSSLTQCPRNKGEKRESRHKHLSLQVLWAQETSGRSMLSNSTYRHCLTSFPVSRLCPANSLPPWVVILPEVYFKANDNKRGIHVDGLICRLVLNLSKPTPTSLPPLTSTTPSPYSSGPFLAPLPQPVFLECLTCAKLLC